MKGWLGCELRKYSKGSRGVNERTDEEMRWMPTAEKDRPLDVEKVDLTMFARGVGPFARRDPLTRDTLKL